jgi:hypothetical protein
MSSDVINYTVIPDFQGTYQQLALIILFFPEKQRVRKQTWHNSRINASNLITDNCNLIDAPTLRRSFENMKRRE